MPTKNAVIPFLAPFLLIVLATISVSRAEEKINKCDSIPLIQKITQGVECYKGCSPSGCTTESPTLISLGKCSDKKVSCGFGCVIGNEYLCQVPSFPSSHYSTSYNTTLLSTPVLNVIGRAANSNTGTIPARDILEINAALVQLNAGTATSNFMLDPNSTQWHAVSVPQPPTDDSFGDTFSKILEVIEGLSKFLPEGGDFVEGGATILSALTTSEGGLTQDDLESLSDTIVTNVNSYASKINTATFNKDATEVVGDTISNVTSYTKSKIIDIANKTNYDNFTGYMCGSGQSHACEIVSSGDGDSVLGSLTNAACDFNSSCSTSFELGSYVPLAKQEIYAPVTGDAYFSTAWLSLVHRYTEWSMWTLSVMMAHECNKIVKSSSQSGTQTLDCNSNLDFATILNDPSADFDKFSGLLSHMTTHIPQFIDHANSLATDVPNAIAQRLLAINVSAVQETCGEYQTVGGGTAGPGRSAPSSNEVIDCTAYYVSDPGAVKDLSNLIAPGTFLDTNTKVLSEYTGLGDYQTSGTSFGTKTPVVSAYAKGRNPSDESAVLDITLQDGRAWLTTVAQVYVSAWNYEDMIGADGSLLMQEYAQQLTTLVTNLCKLSPISSDTGAPLLPNCQNYN